jgi:hypothetical protein
MRQCADYVLCAIKFLRYIFGQREARSQVFGYILELDQEIQDVQLREYFEAVSSFRIHRQKSHYPLIAHKFLY